MPLDGLAPIKGFAHVQGRNYAPVEPLRNASKIVKSNADNPSSFNAFNRMKFEEKRDLYDAQWRELIEQARVIQNLRSGKLVMKRDMTGAGYIFLKPSASRASDRSNFPVFPQNSETLKAKWLKSRPMMEAQAFGDGYRVDQALNTINLVMKYYFRRIFDGDTTFYESDEALSAQDYGSYITQFSYDDRLNQIQQMVPIIQDVNQTIVPGYGACLNCAYEGHPDDFSKTKAAYPQCPECESYNTTKMVPDAIEKVPSIVGVDTISQGDITGRLINFAACRFDPHGYAHQSSHFLYNEYVPLNLARTMFGNDLELTPSESDDIGLQLLDALASHGGSVEAFGENDHYGVNMSGSLDRVSMWSMWLKPEEYAGVKLREPEKTLGGTIPADVDLAEVFPDGYCAVAFEDFRLQVGVFAEEANIASAAYLTVSHSGIGKGIQDGVDIAKDLNEIHSMAMAGLKRYGASGLVIDSQSGLSQENVRNMFKPNKAVFVNLKEAGIDDIRKAVTQMQMNPVNPVLPQYAVQSTNMLNMAMMTGDFAQGMVQDVDINTLGGQQLAHAKAEESKGGILTGKVFHRKQSAAIICKLFRKHIKIPKGFLHGVDQMGPSRTKYVQGADLPEEIDFVAVPDSELPTNSAERKIAGRELVQAAGGIVPLIQAAQAAPKETAWYMEQFGISMPSLDTQQMQLVCLDRIDEIKELSKVYPDPMSILANLKKQVKVEEPLHQLKAEFLGQMLDDDEVDDWDPVMLSAVQYLITLHYDHQAEMQARIALIGQIAQGKVMAQGAQLQQQIMAPIQQQQNEMQMQQQQQQMQMQGEAQKQQQADQADQAVQGGVLNFLGDAAGRAMDDASAQDQHSRDMELAQVNNQSKADIAQAQIDARKSQGQGS